MNDVFRKDYTELTEEQKTQGRAIKEKAEELLALFNQAVPAGERSERSRCVAIARTNLEQAIMWAAKGVYSPKE